MKIYIGYGVGVLSLVVLLAGCSRKDVADDSVPDIALLQEQLGDLEGERGLQETIERGVAMIRTLETFEDRAAVAGWLTGRVVAAADIVLIKALVTGLFDVDEQLGVHVVRWVDSGITDAIQDEWMLFLQEDTFAPVVRVYGHARWLDTYGVDAPMTELLDQLVVLLDPVFSGYAEGVFDQTLKRQLAHADAGRIHELIRLLQSHILPDSHVMAAFLDVQGQALLRDGSLTAAFAHYREYVAVIGEMRFANVLPLLLQKARDADAQGLLVAIRNWVYTAEAFPRLRNRLARWDMVQLREITDIAIVSASIKDLLAKGAPVPLVGSMFVGNLFYPALSRSESDRDALLELADLIRTLESAAADAEVPDHTRTALATGLLDVFFFLKDFQGALARIQAGVPGYDEAWHAELRDKLQAHIAQQEGRAADAVAFYEAHIARARGWENGVMSPMDNRMIFPAEVIALNEQRIGDIWQAEGEVEKATEAYVRAIEQYRLAYEQYGDEHEASQKAMRAVLVELGVEVL
ncbi:MAG: hypothetical protein ACNA71_01210 [Kiritimatiellia bacterium]